MIIMSGRNSQKIEALVVKAIRRLQDVQGSTPREISNYISQEYDVPGPEIKRQVQLALKRGVTYGILQRLKGGYYTYNRDFIGGQFMDAGDAAIEIPYHRRRRGRSRRRSRRRGRRSSRHSRKRRRGRGRRRKSRGRSRRRRGRSRRGRRRSRRRRSRRRRRHGEIGEMEMEEMTKQSITNNNLSRKGSPGAGSSTSASSDEKHLNDPPHDQSAIVPVID